MEAREGERVQVEEPSNPNPNPNPNPNHKPNPNSNPNPNPNPTPTPNPNPNQVSSRAPPSKRWRGITTTRDSGWLPPSQNNLPGACVDTATNGCEASKCSNYGPNRLRKCPVTCGSCVAMPLVAHPLTPPAPPSLPPSHKVSPSEAAALVALATAAQRPTPGAPLSTVKAR